MINKNIFASLFIVGTLASSVALAKNKPKSTERNPSNITSADYPSLAIKGDSRKGKEIYLTCASCHLNNGSGKMDGTFPQIAGQHSTVLTKQLVDIKEGRRENPPMFEIAKRIKSEQEMADLVAYLETLKIPRNNGKGPEYSIDLGKGQQLYQRDCVSCHGSFGEGNSEKFYPVVAGQHYKYIVRQIKGVRDGGRVNAHPGMSDLVKNYTEDEVRSVANYISLLVWPMRSGK